MFDLTKPSNRARLLAGLAAAGLAMAAAPSIAQDIDELTITGRVGPDGQIQQLSRPVSYADLDLTLEADRAVLKDRVQDTARDLCDELGEPRVPVPPLTASCARKAVNDAQSQMRQAFADARPKTGPVVAYVEPAPEPLPSPPPREEAPAASSFSAPVATVEPEHRVITNAPVADTPENRAAYGGPMSNAGRKTAPAGN